MKNLIMVLAVCLTLPALAQKISNQLEFEKGKKLELMMTVSNNIESMGTTSVNAIIERVFDIEDVNDGNAVIEHRVKRVRLKIESMMGNEDFDSEDESDMKGQGGRAMEKTLKNKFTFTVDANGKVTGVKVDDDNPSGNDNQVQDMLSNVLGQLSAGLVPPKPGDRTELAYLPEGEVAVGDSWTDSVENGQASYTVKEISDTEIILDVTEVMNLVQKQDLGGNEITITSTETATGTVTLDRKTRLLKGKQVTTKSEGNISVMGQSMPITSSGTRTWVVR